MAVTIDGTTGVSLVQDGVVTAADMFSGFANGITMADQFRLTSDLTGSANPITSNLERVDENVFGGIGTGMSESSGIFTFPSTGIYLIHFSIVVYTSSTSDYCRGYIRTTNNNSSYQAAATAYASAAGTGTPFNSGSTQFLFDVTDTTNQKVAFRIVQANTSNEVRGLTAENATFMTFIRLGDT